MSFFTAIARFFATVISPLRHPGGRGGATAQDDMADAEAQARRKQWTVVIAVVVIVGSLISLYYTMLPPTAKINRAPFIGLGQVLAEETAKALGNQGRVTVVVADYHEKRGTPMNDQLESFRRTLKQSGGVTIAATEVVTPDETIASGGIPPAQFTDLVKKHAQVGAIVLLMGLPDLDGQPGVTLPERHPKIIAVQSGSAMAKPYFEQGIAEVLILSRVNTTTETNANPTTPRAWFDKYFEVFTAQNYESLPY